MILHRRFGTKRLDEATIFMKRIVYQKSHNCKQLCNVQLSEDRCWMEECMSNIYLYTQNST